MICFYSSEFVRNKLPYKLVKPITDDNVDKFLDGWEDNKVRGLIFEDRPAVRLRYLLTAFHYRDRITFGYCIFNFRYQKFHMIFLNNTTYFIQFCRYE